LYLLLFFII